MEEKKETSPFLLKLQEALKNGKANESTNKINQIDDHSKSLTANDAQDRLTARIEQVGYAKSVTKEEMLKSQLEYETEMEKYRKEEAKFMEIANIENAKSEINATKNELQDVIKEIERKYAESIAKQMVILKELQESFKKKHGEEEYKKSFSSEDTATA